MNSDLKKLDEEEGAESDDAKSERGETNVQPTMQGNVDYTALPDSQESEVDDNGEDNESVLLDLTTNSTKMRMVEQDVSLFDDPTKSHDDWWTEDVTRERTLCELWQETPYLYDMTLKGHHQNEDRPTTLMRFATILQVPRKYKINIVI